MKKFFLIVFTFLVSGIILFHSCSKGTINHASNDINPFTSKFDYVEAGKAGFTDQEALGLSLFDDKCASCHPSTGESDSPALFTNFNYENLGIPENPDNLFYKKNPAGVFEGLAGLLKTSLIPELVVLAGESTGKHKVPTLRNVDLHYDDGILKPYTHNGYFIALKDLVHFMNTRNDGTWPSPEVSETVTENPGNLGLTDYEENAIVAFLGTLSDGYGR
jgi:cytochrome c peroxidase